VPQAASSCETRELPGVIWLKANGCGATGAGGIADTGEAVTAAGVVGAVGPAFAAGEYVLEVVLEVVLDG
jgi:hypothetical protein